MILHNSVRVHEEHGGIQGNNIIAVNIKKRKSILCIVEK